MNPKISVIIPVFNTAKYLPSCLDSVLTQSLQDFEIIAVDDASTDDSSRVLAEYAMKDSRIKVIRLKENSGGLHARITGIRAAFGKYTMFLDSDDGFLPGILQAACQTAEREDADLVNFILEFRLRRAASGKIIKATYPMDRSAYGKDVFQQFFVKNSFHWPMVDKLYRTELCKKTIEQIPDSFCMMADDFCFSTIYAFFARCYVPLRQGGYIYYEPGITGYQKTDLQKFLDRQSPFQALRNVRDFLIRENAWEEYRSAFEHQEQKLLSEYVLRWLRNLHDEDRMKAFNTMFRNYDAFPLFQAFRTFFSDRDERFLEMLSGEDPDSVGPLGKTERMAENLSLQNTRISRARWNEWQSLIREKHYDAVILDPDDDPERLFWDILAIRDAGAAAVCRRTQTYLDTLNRQGLNAWLMEDRALRQASLILASDEDSAAWFCKRNCYAGISLENICPPQCSAQTSAAMSALGNSERKTAYYRIDPAEDGETFIPFFRKLDHLFRKLPTGFRKQVFSRLAGIYNRFTGN